LDRWPQVRSVKPNLDMVGLGRILLLFGGSLVVVGMLLMVAPKTPWIGKLPGDFHIKKENVEIYFPITTSVVLSIVLNGIFWIIDHVGKR
jgi:hypothetical protein